MNRRKFLLAAGGVAGTVAATSPAVAQEGNDSGNASGGNASGGNESGGGGGGGGPVDYGLSGANGYEGPGSGTDATGQSEVTIQVGAGSGGLAFAPAAVHVDPGTTITWEWTGEGGSHNVAATSDNADFESSIQSSGTFEWQVPDDLSGIVEYQCDPHSGQGMLGAIAVGSDVPRAEPAAPVEPAVSGSARTLGIATLIAMFSTLGLAFFFLKYGGDYED
jgi:halocyanin-like protein